MLDKRKFNENKLYFEMPMDEQAEWFGYNRQSFLNNIDTFYYSVKFKNDFRHKTRDKAVLTFRKHFDLEYRYMQHETHDNYGDVYINGFDRPLMLKSVTFSRFYNICLSYPEYFDIFFAPTVPQSGDGSESVTSECVVQIRSYMLWLMGARDAFENSYRYVTLIAEHFGLEIEHVQENRADYCWHTNYLDNPEEFFNPDNFYKMRVDRFKNATYVTNKVGSEDYEIDYVALGKRSDKVFVRIYQKTREVIEQGYKPWFFLIWEMNGLISKYDRYVYERCYQHRSWHYRFKARLEFYREHGADPVKLQEVDDILNSNIQVNDDRIIKLAEELTPRLHYVINVEYQVMRRHSKSYELIPFKGNEDKEECERIYDYLDNRKVIQDYLTFKVLRLVSKTGDANKARRDLCPFWAALRRTRCLDMRMTSEEVHLVRQYNRKLNAEAMKKRVINSCVTLGFYQRGINHDSPIQDAMEALCRMNDNDIRNAMEFKKRKRLQLNEEELKDVFESNDIHRFEVLDTETGVIYDNYNLDSLDLQDKYKNVNGWEAYDDDDL